MPAVGHHTNQAHFSAFGQCGHCSDALESHVHLAARHVERGLAGTFVRDMFDIDAGVGGEQCRTQVLRAAISTGCIGDAAWCGFGGSHQLGHCLVGRIGTHRDAELNGCHLGDVSEICDRVERCVLVQVRHHGQNTVVEAADGVAVGGCFGQLVGTDEAGGTQDVLDHDGLTHVL